MNDEKKRKIAVGYAPWKGAFEALEARYEVIYPREREMDREEMKCALREAVGVVMPFNMKVDEDLLSRAEHLEIVANYAVGYNNIDLDLCRARGIAVGNTPDPVVEPTAEMGMSLMLSVLRRIADCDRRLKDGTLKWGVFENLGMGAWGKTMGIVGMGRIGSAIARRAKPFGMDILYHNRHRSPRETECGATYEPDLKTLMRKSDVVMVCVPLDKHTHHLIGVAEIDEMKTSGIIVNVARGAVIDECAMADALECRRIAGAGLDVYEHEPDIEPRLLKMGNVTLAPHNGTATWDARTAMARYAAENIIRYFEGRPFARVV